MKIVHAKWEQRNMGVDCWEVQIEKNDLESDFLNRRYEFESEYTVVKVPSNMPDFGFLLQNNGYKYVETTMPIHRDTSIPPLTKIQERILSDMSYTEMNEIDKEDLFIKIKSGLFTTDRVYIDPYFSIEQAQNRYIGWINDELRWGAKLYKINFRLKTIGFFVLREKDKEVFYSALGGIYQDIKIVGAGVAMDYFELMAAKELGGKKLLAAVSTNNGGALTIPMQLGYSIDRIDNVYIKHCAKKGEHE